MTVRELDTTTPIRYTQQQVDPNEILEEILEHVAEAQEHSGCRCTQESSQMAYGAHAALEQRLMTHLFNQIAPQMTQPAEAPMLDLERLEEIFNAYPTFTPDLSQLDSDVPAAGDVPMPNRENSNPLRPENLETANRDLNTLLNAIQGDEENDFDFGVNWGPFSDNKEKFDNKVAKLRANPTRENFDELQSFVRDHASEIGDDAEKLMDRVGQVVGFIEEVRPQVTDRDITPQDGIDRVDEAVAEHALDDIVNDLRRNESHTLSDFGNWGPMTSDKEAWDNLLKDFRNYVRDGDIDGARGHYAKIVDYMEGKSGNFPRETRAMVQNLEQYIDVAVLGENAALA